MDYDVGSTGPGKFNYGFNKESDLSVKIERKASNKVIRPITIIDENDELVEQFSTLVMDRTPLPIIKNLVSNDETVLWSIARKAELVTNFYKIMERHYRK